MSGNTPIAAVPKELLAAVVSQIVFRPLCDASSEQHSS